MNEYLVESVARAICASKGHNPNQMVVSGQPYFIEGKPFAAVSAFVEPLPLWESFRSDAEAAIKAIASYLAPEQPAEPSQ